MSGLAYWIGAIILEDSYWTVTGDQLLDSFLWSLITAVFILSIARLCNRAQRRFWS